MPLRSIGLGPVLFLLACSGERSAGSDSESAFPPLDEVRAILQARVDAGFAKGIVVGLFEADGSTHALAVGEAGNGARLDENTLFEIGSVTKVFAATLLAQMTLEGLVDLDDPIEDYLPEGVVVPSRAGRDITFLDIAMHRSGLPSMPTNVVPAFPFAYPTAALYDFLAEYELPRDVGSQPEYSNLAVGMMGHALALLEADGDFELLLRTRVLDPLEMNSTGIDLPPELESRLAVGHRPDGGPARPFPSVRARALAAAGALRSSVSDLLRFLDANVGEPTNDLERAMRLTHAVRGPLIEEVGINVGLNWFSLDLPGGRVVWHNGGTYGFGTFIGFDPERGVGAVVLTNSRMPNEDIGLHLVNQQVRLATMPSERTEVAIDDSLLTRYEGTYLLMDSPVVVELEDNGLWIELAGAPRTRLRAASTSVFYSEVMPVEYEFVDAEDGSVRMIMRGGGLEIPVERVAEMGGGV